MLVPRALWLLLYLRVKGSIRRALFSGSARKTIATVVGAAAMGLWLANLAFRGFTQARTPSEGIRVVGPAVLAGLCLMPLALGGAARMLAFAPAEVDQLFPAPFSRRQLVAYRIVKVSLASLFTGVFYTVILGGASVSWWVSFTAACLAWIFAGLLTMSFALVEATLAQRAALLRLIPQALLLGAIAAACWRLYGVAGAGWSEGRLRSAFETPLVSALAAPFRPFIMLFTARNWSREVPLWLAVCLAEVVLLALVTLRLDTAWLDSSIAATHARAERLEQRRRGGRPARPGSRLKKLIPALEFAGPARAIIRRQLRASPSILLVPPGIAAGLAVVVLLLRWSTPGADHSEAILSLTGTLGAMSVLILPAVSRVDFRSDIDHVELLKSLPISASAIARAELAIPTALLTIAFWEILAVAAVYAGRPGLIAGLAIAGAPAAVLLAAVENALFLIVPTRPGPVQAAGLQVTGKRVITFAAKLAVVGLGGAIAVGAALLAQLLSGSWLAAGIAAAVVLSLEAWAALAAVAVLFRRFDVGVDMPD